MMHAKWLFAVGLLSSQLAVAGISTVPRGTVTTVVPGQASTTFNRGYAGLKWEIPGPLAPTLVLGVRRSKVDSDGDTRGGDLSFGISFAQGVKLEKLRLKGFSGDEGVQGELGAGYDFAANSLFAGPSVNGPYANAGVDWLLSGGLKPYVMLHTMGKVDKPQGSTASTAPADCPAGFEPVPGDNTICQIIAN